MESRVRERYNIPISGKEVVWVVGLYFMNLRERIQGASNKCDKPDRCTEVQISQYSDKAQCDKYRKVYYMLDMFI